MSAEGSTPTHAPRGAIHDIGYRHYEGERLGRAYVRAMLYADTLRGAFGIGRSTRSKIAPAILCFVMWAPSLAWGIATGYVGLAKLPVQYSELLLIFQPVVTIFLGIMATVAVSRDLRFKATSLYFSRPLSRGDYVVAKYGAAATALLVFMLTPLTLLLLGAWMADLSLREHVPDYLRAVAAAGVLSLLLAGIGLAIAAFTPRRGIGVAAIVAVLGVLTPAQLILGEIADETGSPAGEVYSAMVSPYTLVVGATHGVLGGDVPFRSEPDEPLEVGVFCAYTLALVGAGYGLLLMRYRRVSVS